MATEQEVRDAANLIRQAAIDSQTKPGEQAIKHIDRGEALTLEGMARDDDPRIKTIKRRAEQLLAVIPDDDREGRAAHSKVIEGADLGVRSVRND